MRIYVFIPVHCMNSASNFIFLGPYLSHGLIAEYFFDAELHGAIAKVPAQSGGNKDASALLARFMPELVKAAHVSALSGCLQGCVYVCVRVCVCVRMQICV